MKTPLFAAATLLCTLHAVRADDAAFATFNQAALARSFTLPELGEPRVLASGAASWSGVMNLANEYRFDRNAREELLQDGESARIALTYRRSFAPGWEWNAQLPLLIQGGGFLDHGIEQWHAIFGLPNGGRELAPRNRYRFRYVRDGVTRLDLMDGGTGLGDANIGAGWQWRERTALRGSLKLPTGDADRLAGGSLGGALWLDHAMGFAKDSRWSSTLSGGVSTNRRVGPLRDFQQRGAAYGGASLGYALTARVQIAAQLAAHTPLYRDADLRALTAPGVQLLFGGRWRASAHTQIELAVAEDPVVGPSPDFGIHLGFAMR